MQKWGFGLNGCSVVCSGAELFVIEPGEDMTTAPDYQAMLAVALGEARLGRKEGGIPIGAAIFDATGKLVGAGHNRRVQQGDPSVHGETDAFRQAGRQTSYKKLI